MPLALFVIKDLRSKKALAGETFSDKAHAKARRAELNTEAGETRYFVSPGPDHRKHHDGSHAKTG